MNETSNLQRILDLQRRVSSSQTMLKKLFFEALRGVRANRGFLAFEDPNGYLSILVSEGKFWHLPKSDGITGQAFLSGQTVISGRKGAPRGVKADREAFSEMAVPVRKGQEVVGAMFFDNISQEGFEFGESHQAVCERYAERLCHVLERREPWGFRSWWTNHQMRKVETLADSILHGLRGILAQIPRASGAVFLVDGQRHGDPIVGGDEELEHQFSDPVEDAKAGKASLNNEPRTVATCYVPFPASGPVCGYVKVHTMQIGLLDKSTQEAIERLVEEVSYDPLAPAATTIQFPEEHFFGMIYGALAHSDGDKELHRELESISRQVNVLCRAPTRILYRATDFEEVDPENVQDYAAIPVLPRDLDQMIGDFPLRRPHHQRRGRWLSSPVFVRDQLVGSVDIESTSANPGEDLDSTEPEHKQSLDDDYNGPFSQSVAVLVGRVYSRYSDRLESGD